MELDMTETPATKYKEFMTKLSGKDYMIVQGRVKWFRDDNGAKGCIDTDFKQVGEYTIAICKVTIDGNLIASGSATVRSWKKNNDSRDIEKAETAAIGRALSNAGYGTQFSGDELNDTDFLADSPSPIPEEQELPDKTDKRYEMVGKPQNVIKLEPAKGQLVGKEKRWIGTIEYDDVPAGVPITFFDNHLAMIDTVLGFKPGSTKVRLASGKPMTFEKPLVVIPTYPKGDFKVDRIPDTFKDNPAIVRMFLHNHPEISLTTLRIALDTSDLDHCEHTMESATHALEAYIELTTKKETEPKQADSKSTRYGNAVKPRTEQMGNTNGDKVGNEAVTLQSNFNSFAHDLVADQDIQAAGYKNYNHVNNTLLKHPDPLYATYEDAKQWLIDRKKSIDLNATPA